MLMFYCIAALLMFALWFGVGAKMPWYDRPSWPMLWIVSIVMGMFWPLSLAFIVVNLVQHYWG